MEILKRIKIDKFIIFLYDDIFELLASLVSFAFVEGFFIYFFDRVITCQEQVQ